MSRIGWNKLAGEFENSVCDITATSGDTLAELVRCARPTGRQTLVDAGCGIGTFIDRFGPQFGSVVAFDFARAMVQRARSRCRRLAHVQWRTLALEDAAEQVGAVGHLVVCLNVITAPDAPLRRRQWQSLAGLIRPGGHLLVVVPSLESARFVAERDQQAFNGTVTGGRDLVQRRDTQQKHFSRGQLRRRLEASALEVASLRRIHYPWEEDGLQHDGERTPWDWACLARKSA